MVTDKVYESIEFKTEFTTKNEKEFMAVLETVLIQGKKLLYGAKHGNRIMPSHEIRFMPTVGGIRYAVSEIYLTNQKASGRYTSDPEEVFLWAVDIEHTPSRCVWYLVDDCEHTINTEY